MPFRRHRPLPSRALSLRKHSPHGGLFVKVSPDEAHSKASKAGRAGVLVPIMQFRTTVMILHKLPTTVKYVALMASRGARVCMFCYVLWRDADWRESSNRTQGEMLGL